VIIWGGGVWNWFDPLTLIKAVKIISLKRNDVKLFFMGVTHPNSGVPKMRMLSDAVELARELGILDKYVFFNFGWVDYNERVNYLMEADIGVSCHFDTLETQLSFRTRILDYLWAGLPIVCTKGDYFADLVQAEKLGFQVDYEDAGQFAENILRILDDKQLYETCSNNVKRVAEIYRWKNVTEPLVKYCQNPVRHKNHMTRSAIPGKAESVDEYGETRSRESVGKSYRHGSVLDTLSRVEERQSDLEHSVNKIKRTNENTYDVVRDLQDWSIMMNGRFNKAKKLANPFYAIKALFRRLLRRV
jgi:hypothetical protein